MTGSSDESIRRVLEKMQHDIEEIKSSMKLFMLQSRGDIANILQRDLTSPEKKLAYELTDGNRSAYQIAEILKVSMTSIHRWWRDWERSGLLTRTEAKGKTSLKKRFDLADLGIEVPDISYFQNKNGQMTEIPNKNKLMEVLRDSCMFKSNADLKEFAERVFGTKIAVTDTECLIDEISDLFLNSPRIKQMMFMQALRQQAKSTGSSFSDYFEFWERHIKGEI